MRDDTKATRIPEPSPPEVGHGNNLRGPGALCPRCNRNGPYALICPRCNRAGPYFKTGQVLQDGVLDVAFLGCQCGARLHYDSRKKTLVEV